jgi:hypothetical protein
MRDAYDSGICLISAAVTADLALLLVDLCRCMQQIPLPHPWPKEANCQCGLSEEGVRESLVLREAQGSSRYCGSGYSEGRKSIS